MKKNDIMSSLTRALGRTNLKLKKHSPEILVVTGVVGVVASAVMACRATTKVDFVLEETREKLDTIHQGVEDGKVWTTYIDEDGQPSEKIVPYSKEDGDKDITITYAKTGLKFVKLYGPSVALGLVSIGCILGGHNILRKRNIALAAAYATEHLGFKEYRERLIERFGKDLDRELKYNIKAKEIEEKVVDENGNEQTVTKTIETINPAQLKYSTYARCFDETSRGWQKDAELNLYFVRQVEAWANNRLEERGFLFLNEVYEALGFDATKAGAVVGWTYVKDGENTHGDNYVCFGIYDLYDAQKRAFVNGYERSIWLDFNVDGNILDEI